MNICSKLYISAYCQDPLDVKSGDNILSKIYIKHTLRDSFNMLWLISTTLKYNIYFIMDGRIDVKRYLKIRNKVIVI